MKKIIFCFLISLSILLHAENTLRHKIDSLKKEMEFAGDKEKVNILAELSISFRDSENEEGIKYGKQGLVLARKLNLPDKEGEILTTIAFNYLAQLKYTQALNYTSEALIIANRTNNPSIFGSAYNHLGLYYYWRGINDKAAEYFLKALKYRQISKNKLGESNTLNGLGLVFNRNKDYDLAMDYFYKSLAIKKELMEPNAIVRTLTNIANCLKDSLNFTGAQKYLDTALTISRQNKYDGGIALCLSSMGEIAMLKNDYKTALPYYLKTLELYKKIGKNGANGVLESYLRMSDYYNKTENYRVALKYLDSAHIVAKSNELFGQLPKIYSSYGINYEKLNDFKNALTFNRLSVTTKDSTFNIEKSRLINEMQVIYQVEEKEKELQAKQNEIYYTLGIIAILVLVLILVALLNYQKRKTNIELKKKNIQITEQKELLTETLATLKESEEQTKKYADELRQIIATKDKFFSIISHDLKGPFTAILGFSQILSKDSDQLTNEQIANYSSDLYKTASNQYRLLENLLDWARIQTNRMEFNPENICAGDEINSIIEILNSVADQKKIKIISSIDKDLLIKTDKNMFHTVMRNLINNSIKYSNSGSDINISGIQNLNETEFNVSDNGVGIDEKTLSNLFKIDKTSSLPGTAKEKGTGLGLALCKEMIENHGGNIKVESKKGEWTKVTFTIPSIQSA